MEVAWASAESTDVVPALAVLRVGRLSLWSRRGAPWFKLVARRDVSNPNGSEAIDPLIVRDLNGDGRLDIVLAGRNMVFRNHGRGAFTVGPLSQKLTAPFTSALIADFDGDGRLDLLGADSQGLVSIGDDGSGRFNSEPRRVVAIPMSNPWVMTAGDIDGDGDLDVWVGQYKVPYRFGQMPVPYYDANDSFPSYLLRNDGGGRFTDVTRESGLDAKRHRRAYSASLIDLDGDRDLDLTVVSDFAGGVVEETPAPEPGRVWRMDLKEGAHESARMPRTTEGGQGLSTDYTD